MTPQDLAIALAGPIRVRLGLPLAGLAGGRVPGGARGDRWSGSQLLGVASIGGRDEALEQIQQILEVGSRAEYARQVRWHRELPEEARSTGFYLLDRSEWSRRIFVRDHHGRPEETNPAAWDIARVVHYAGLAWAAAYLSEAEAWGAIARAARIAQDAYDSWQAYGRGLVYGRWYWAGFWDDGMKATAAAIAKLLRRRGGWCDLDWRFDVGALERVATGAGSAGVAALATRSSWWAMRMFIDCPACQLPVLVREVTGPLRCDGCGERSEIARCGAWGHSTSEHDADDEISGLFFDLADRSQRVLRTRVPHAACATCAAPITAEHARAGDVRCGCGALALVVAVPPWLRDADMQLRFVVGGPLTLGRADSVLYVLRDEP